MPVQYVKWVGNALQGDLGFDSRQLPVAETIVSRIPITLELAALSLLIGMVIGIPAGVIAAVRRGKASDYAATSVALVGLSLPNFWLGLMLIILFAVELDWLPAGGYVPFSEDPIENLKHMLLPAIVLGTGLSAVLMRQMRSSMLDSLSADYVRTARAKGLSERRVVGVHALRNSLITVTTVIGLQLGALISGAVITETIFGIAGFGRLTVDADQPARLRAPPGRRPRRGRGLRRRQLRGRHRLLAAQPAHPRLGEAGMTSVRRASRQPRRLAPRARRRRLLLRRFLRRPFAVAGLVVAVGFVLMAVFAPVIAPYDPNATDFDAILETPSREHLLGTDELGRDVLSRIIFGARASILAGVFATLLAIVIAVPIGLVAGYYRGWIDPVISRVTDVLLAFPFLILAVGLAAILGPSLLNATIALGLAAARGSSGSPAARRSRCARRTTCAPRSRTAPATRASSAGTSSRT